MFNPKERTTNLKSAAGLAELIYYSTVRNVRKGHRNPILALLMSMMQTLILVIVFYFIFAVLGLRGTAIRGDFILYLLSGIFLFITHTKAVGAVTASEGPTSNMMNHAPMNTAIAIASSALSALYIQTISAAAVLWIYHTAWTPITIYDPVGTFAMFLLAWFSGVAVGMVFLAIKPWLPEVAGIGSMIYMRANMIASGKMFVANTMPTSVLVFFWWSPLFHCIDQARGFAFINYNPRYSSIEYPLLVSVGLIMIGLMGEFYTRKRASISWNAGR